MPHGERTDGPESPGRHQLSTVGPLLNFREVGPYDGLKNCPDHDPAGSVRKAEVLQTILKAFIQFQRDNAAYFLSSVHLNSA